MMSAAMRVRQKCQQLLSGFYEEAGFNWKESALRATAELDRRAVFKDEYYKCMKHSVRNVKGALRHCSYLSFVGFSVIFLTENTTAT
jgi:hypothetical protein